MKLWYMNNHMPMLTVLCYCMNYYSHDCLKRLSFIMIVSLEHHVVSVCFL